MQHSKSRSGSSEMAPRGTVSSSRSVQTSKPVKVVNYSLEFPDSKVPKVSDRKPLSRTTSASEKRNLMQPQIYQLQEELKKAREERTRALEEMEELRSMKKMLALSKKEELEIVEKKVEKARESERNMLESLISQTKQLEQTKISIEEARLEIRSLQEIIKSMEESSYRDGATENLERNRRPLELIQAQDEIRVLRNELRLATEAEEKSKQAMDSLAIALNEVSTEASQVKAKLSVTQLELEKVRLEGEQSKSSLTSKDEKLQAAVEESERLKLELDDSIAIWKEKESGFMNCMKASDEEITELKLENDKLIELLRGAREETSRLRDILKQAVNEATVVKETFEIVRNENSQLKDLILEKENELQRIRQDYDSLKVSEGAAVDSVKELKRFLDTTSSIDSMIVDTKTQNRKNSRESIYGSEERKSQLFESHSVVFDAKAPPSLYAEDKESMSAIFDHVGRGQSNAVEYERGSVMIQKKRKPMMKRFGDIMMRRSFRK